MRTAFPALNMAAIAALLAGASMQRGEPNVIENNGQAMPKGAQRAIRDARATGKDRSRKAAEELVRISNQTLVVAHLHPRWLRQLTNDVMDRGWEVTMADIECWREMGDLDARAALFRGDYGHG